MNDIFVHVMHGLVFSQPAKRLDRGCPVILDGISAMVNPLRLFIGDTRPFYALNVVNMCFSGWLLISMIVCLQITANYCCVQLASYPTVALA